MKYSHDFKENIVQKALARRNVREVAEETGVTAWSIYNYLSSFFSLSFIFLLNVFDHFVILGIISFMIKG